jgi:simple sugar transport system substrate-binding protein
MKPTPSRRKALLVVTALAAGALSVSLPVAAQGKADAPLKIGFVYVSPIGDAGWTFQHDIGRKEMEKALGGKVATKYVESVPEGADAERVIRELAQSGHNLIFTTSFGYMNPTLKVAQAFPKANFNHATGYKTAKNVGTYNARFYEGRYLAGIVAGRMSKSNVAGYVAAFPIPEVVQGINAFTLGLRSVNPRAQVKVIWTQAWHDPARERDAALSLLNQDADVLTHHTNSTATAIAAQERQRWVVAYNSDMRSVAPQAQLTAVTHHWGDYYVRVARSVIAGQWKPSGLWGGLREDMVRLAEWGPAVSPALRERVRQQHAQIVAGHQHPFGGRLVDSEGTVRQAGGTMADETLARIDWFVQGVQGRPPSA